jgi:hypothetical protein
MEPKFDAILKDASGMAWELRGSAVQTLTQEDAFDAKGERRHTNKNNTLAKRWADMMTKEFSALAVGDPVFADLQNCMEMAVVSALILKERLPEKAGNSFPTLFTSTDLKTEVYNVPTQVPSVASLVRKTYSVSGGVTINSWAIADNAKTDDSVASLRDKTASKGHATWWWN